MKKNLILYILLISSINILSKPDCTSPSKFVLQFLANSTTLYRGSRDWITAIQRSNSKANTVFVSTEDNSNISGVGAQLFMVANQNLKADQNNITACFDITNNAGTISIISKIEEARIKRNPNEIEIEQGLSINGKSERQADLMTECQYSIETIYDSTENALRSKMRGSCRSKLPIALFMQQIRKNSKI
jgi:hypothetical protein